MILTPNYQQCREHSNSFVLFSNVRFELNRMVWPESETLTHKIRAIYSCTVPYNFEGDKIDELHGEGSRV